MAEFVHLHHHSEYSLLDGISKIKDMVSQTQALGMKAIAMTDHGNMFGAVYFYSACKAAGIKPILGCEIYMAQRTRFDKDNTLDRSYNHLILLAKNNTGYKNLMKIISKSQLEGYYYKPRADVDLLREYSEGLICLSACVNGFIADPLLQNQDDLAENRAKTLNEIFGQGNFYFELQRHIDVPPQAKANEKLIALSRKLGIPVVATNDNHYVYKTDAQAQEILLCIQTQTTIDTPNRKLSMVDSPDFYMKSPEEMADLFPELPEALENSVKIADMCDVEIILGEWHMPNFEVPDGLTSKEYLRKLVEEGMTYRYGNTATALMWDRVNYELDVICTKGYETYFLVVGDFVNWAKDNGISVGPGRGSAAGSVVAYVLKITDIDPFFFKLPFERFLNPLRPSAPDIDLDFADTRREEVIQYVTRKYGVDKVAQIITFGRMEAKGSVRDVGRALGMPYTAPDRISKLIPPGWQGQSMSLEKAMNENNELKQAYLNEPDTKRLIDLSQRIEGVVRHSSVHAAGVVIADAPITDYCPVQRETNGEKIVTQYDMHSVGENGVGLLKMDFLGLRNLTIIEESLKFIKENQDMTINISTIPLDNKKAYELLASAETTGIFQFESSGMRRYIKELKPTNIFDVMAMVALYRPGPMANIPEFIARKHNPSLISYPDPRLEDVLKESYGMLTYQDDVMLTSIKLAGYSWLDADKLRKAMGKKIPEVMKKEEDKFIKGAVENGLTEKRARELFAPIAPFAGYGFNKAHAACYASIAYRTAYLKANYPVEFMTALLTAESRGTTGPQKNEKIALAVSECKRLGIKILPPDINKSLEEFSIENHVNIRFGFTAVKNIGAAAVAAMIESRGTKSFNSLEDFCQRTDLGPVNKKTMESLIKAGAFDAFGNRALLLATLVEITERTNKHKKSKSSGQASLFDDDEIDEAPNSYSPEDVEDFPIEQKLAFEKELLGFYLTAHPQEDVLRQIKTQVDHELEEISEELDGHLVKVGGIVETVKRIFTKKSNAEMAFITLASEKGAQLECVLFPKVFEQYSKYLIQDTVLIAEGKIDVKDGKAVMLVQKLTRPIPEEKDLSRMSLLDD